MQHGTLKENSTILTNANRALYSHGMGEKGRTKELIRNGGESHGARGKMRGLSSNE